MAKRKDPFSDSVNLSRTHSFTSLPLSINKYNELSELVARLSVVRALVWDMFGLKPGYVSGWTLCSQWANSGFGEQFNTQNRLWKSVVKDTLGNIEAYHAACMAKVATFLYRKYGAEIGYEKCKLISKGPVHYESDHELHRLVRKHFRFKRSKCKNQLVLDTSSYTSYVHNGRCYISIMGLVAGQRIKIPVRHNKPLDKTLRIVVNDDKTVTVHTTHTASTIDNKLPKAKATQARHKHKHILALDKGYTEVYTDHHGHTYGEGFGELLSSYSDGLKTIYQSRNKLLAIAKKAQKNGNHAKYNRIMKHNLGRIKLDHKKKVQEKRVETFIFKATHDVFAKANIVVVEDLNKPMQPKEIGKNNKRRLSAWVRGILKRSLNGLSSRYGVPVIEVNPAYTSQIDHRSGLLLGSRVRDQFYHASGGVSGADHNAAINILTRYQDGIIPVWWSKQRVYNHLFEATKQAVEKCPTQALAELDPKRSPSAVKTLVEKTLAQRSANNQMTTQESGKNE